MRGTVISVRPDGLLDEALRGRVERAREVAASALLRERGTVGWVGELSASALSTATAVTALTLVARRAAEDGRADGAELMDLVRRGRAWLVAHQNADGGWGDTTRSFSNISTTTLVWAALGLEREADAATARCVAAAEAWLTKAAGSLEPARLVEAIERRYGDDRTFSIPILTMCALCGRLGSEREAWARVRQLPFEVAALPQRWFGALRLPVVSYALPALIAIGQVRHGKRPTGNVLARWIREQVKARTLRVLERLQPANGGFLEATPLTSFVTMSLAGLELTGHPVVRRGVAFLAASVRADGSWPIDTNLATWVTTLAVNALAEERSAGTRDGAAWDEGARAAVGAWLLRQQYRSEHPYTLARPGGWAWTDLPGGVPDADDTAGAVVALVRMAGAMTEENAQRLTFNAERSSGVGGEEGGGEAVRLGVKWLLELQNRDGGVPTFCRGWGRLPFDRSSPDITAHAMRAWVAVRDGAEEALRRRIDAALGRAVIFLRKTQRAEGAWVPLWFGHQEHPADENPLYGTARVVVALSEVAGGGGSRDRGEVEAMIGRAVAWLVRAQGESGGWSGAVGAKPTMEETGLALEALAAAWARREVWARAESGAGGKERAAVCEAIERGAVWLCDAVERRAWTEPAPIGFYFAKLWYFERLYPLIFATGALERLTAVARSEVSGSVRRSKMSV